MNINNMNLMQKIFYFRSLEKDDICNNYDYILSMNIDDFGLLFLNVNNDIKKCMLDDEILFDKVMSIKKNKNKRLIIELLDDEVRDYILRNKYLVNSFVGKRLVISYLCKLDYNKFTRFIDKYELDYLGDEVNIIEEFDKYNMGNYIKNNVNKSFNPIYLIKIKNGYEFLIYEKFGILVSVDKVLHNYIYFKDGVRVSYNLLVVVNRKHIVKLIELLKNKDRACDNNQLFVSVIKLYMLFGYDDAKKVIEDFYTYATNASLERASRCLFLDNRREFRVKNQNKYYYFGMENDVLNSIYNGDREIFKNICLKNRDEYIDIFIEKIKCAIGGVLPGCRSDIVKDIIVDEINKRENYYKELDIAYYRAMYLESARCTGVNVREIYDIFKDIDIDFKVDYRGHIIKNRELIDFLLGNCKRDNDCLLRLVFNKHALGLEREFYNIVNNFDKVKDCILENDSLSLHSFLDVIDISKTLLYELKPDEVDITLETLSKILNSRKYLKENPEDILKRVLKLHKLRKKKVWGSIPVISGEVFKNSYQVCDYYDESLLSSGIDGGDCFKVGGEGEEFLEYCLTSPNGAVVYLYCTGVKYILPCVRTGNMLNINSVDPKFSSKDEAISVLNVLEFFSKKMINDTDSGIDIVTVCDVHMEEYILCKNYEKIEFKYAIPMDAGIYTDYNKKEVTNYIIAKRNKDVLVDYNFSDYRYYHKRNVPYVYISDQNSDMERIDMLVNYVYYSSIDYLDCNNVEKEFMRDNYKRIDISDFVYIVGNNDWFIGVDKGYNVRYYILPYDERVMDEFNYYKEDVMRFVKGSKKYKRKKI